MGILCDRAGQLQNINSQGRILAVWILVAKLPNSHLNFAVDFLVDFSSLLFPKKKAQKNPPKNPRKIHLGLCSDKFPADFCRSLFSINRKPRNPGNWRKIGQKKQKKNILVWASFSSMFAYSVFEILFCSWPPWSQG